MENVIALLTLILLEIVLGIDNIIFISIVTGKLPREQQRKARRLGLILAMLMRLLLLTLISLILKLQGDLFRIFSIGISGKDIILILGGLFLLYKSAKEIHQRVDEEGEETPSKKGCNIQQSHWTDHFARHSVFNRQYCHSGWYGRTFMDNVRCRDNKR